MGKKIITITSLICDGCGIEVVDKALPDGWIAVGGYVEAFAGEKKPARVTVVGENALFHSIKCMTDTLAAERAKIDGPAAAVPVEPAPPVAEEPVVP